MGLDIQKLIAAAEAKVYGEKNGADGKLNTDAEISVFSDLLKKEVANEQEFNEIMGLALGNGAPAAKSPRKANGNEGGGIVINVNNSVNIVINITVDANIEDIIKQLMEQIAKLEAQSEANIQNIISQFATQLFAKLGGNYEDIMQQILEALNKIEGNQGDISNKMDVMYKGLMDAMKTMFTMLDKLDLNGKAILEAVQNSNLKQEEQIKLLGKIYEAMQKLTDNFNDFTKVENKQFEALFAMLEKGDVAIQDVVALLQAIKNDTSKGNETTAEILDVVKGFRADFNKFSVEQQKQFNQVIQLLEEGAIDNESVLALLNAIKNNTDKGNDKLDAILAAIKDFKASFDKLSDEQQENFNQVMDLIKNINVSGGGTVNVDLTEIVALLKAIKEDTSEGNKIATDILNAIKDFRADFDFFTKEQKEQYNNLLQLFKNGSVKLEDVVALLNAIKSSGEKNVELTQNLVDDVAAFRKDFNNYTEVEKQQFENLVNLITTIAEGCENKLDKVIDNQNTIIEILEGFKASIVEIIGQNNDAVELLNKILNKIGSGCKCNVNGEELMKILQEILQAIKDHKCECNCNCGDDGKKHNEGIDDDWNGDYNDLLGGSLARARSWFDDETTGVAEVQINGANGRDGKFKGPDGKIYIRNNGKVYDLNGRPIR